VSDRRRALLTAALGFTRLAPRTLELRLLHAWLATWAGVGLIVTGMARQGYRLHLTNIEDGVWRATFSRSVGFAQDGFGMAPIPWGAVQQAAWKALRKATGPA
jgi:hypothetical protein